MKTCLEKEIKIAKRNQKIANIILLLVLVIFFGLIMYMVIPVEVYKNNNLPMKIITPIVYAGEEVIYEADFCKLKDYPAKIDRQLVNDVLINYPISGSNYPIGCHKIRIPLKVPDYAESGEYFVRGNIHYKVNPFKIVTYTVESEEFRVIGDKE